MQKRRYKQRRNNKYYMRLALKLALKAKGETFPNPLVGAVVVKNDKIVGRGWHHKAGTAHAEIIALKQAGNLAQGAVLNVSLEPCSHFGRTGPCVNEIIKHKIKKVVIAMVDPNPLNNGKGIKILKQNGIEVEAGLLEKEAEELNRPFIKYITKRMPFVTAKSAQSLDGKIATKAGESKWITSKHSRDYSHQLRRYYDGIMFGIETVLKDNPLLLPVPRNRNLPIKIILDSYLKIPLNARLLSKNSSAPTIIAVSKKIKNSKRYQEKIKSLVKKNVKFLFIPEKKKGLLDLKELLHKLAGLEICNILVEGGGALIGNLYDNKLVDKVLFFIAPKIIGGKCAVSSVGGEGIKNINNVCLLKNVNIKQLGEDILIEADTQ